GPVGVNGPTRTKLVEFRSFQSRHQDSCTSHPYRVRRRNVMQKTLLISLFFAYTGTLYAQSGTNAPPLAKPLSLSGPRFGVTMLSDGVIAKLAERDIRVGSTISQFGWQFERQFYTKSSGVTALNEWVVLVGGLDQSVVIPSVNWIVGLRTKE